jgi:crotonobetainyl-CoA:carnitine CoA-transferase CaiB-like acyl-CoA transferase
VLDLGSFVAGPFGSSLLSDFGAEVIKIEGPGGDPYRVFTVSFLVFHKGQKNVVLDLKKDEGKAALYDIVRSADVLLDNVRPGVRERIGTDYATLAEVNPNLIRATVTAWGPGNSLSPTPAFDPLLQARSGLIAAQGGDAAPCNSAMLVHDIGTGTLIAFGILAALYARARDGLGQEVVTTMANSSIMLQSGEFVRYDNRPAPATGDHDYVGDAALHRLYPTGDGWLALAATTSEHAAGVQRALGLDSADLLGAPARGPIADAIVSALASKTASEAVELLAAQGVPAAPVLGRGGFLTDPWIKANRIFTEITDPDVGPCTVLRTYAEWSRSRHDTNTPAELPGVSTRVILQGIGYDDAKIDALLALGAAKQR